MIKKYKSAFWVALVVALMPFLGGCHTVLLNPKGMVGASERELIIIATLLMLIVVIPVFILTAVFVWKYRASNTQSTYTPDWAHSNKIEFFMWSIPIIIIAILATITWKTTHELDPYRPLDVKGKPLTIEVVALDWKWLFFYPEQNIATVNYIQFPANRPINFKVTSDAPMNSFMIPQLGGQIYAMAGMQTKLHLIANHQGLYDGLSVSFSGRGFSHMNFKARASSQDAFNNWVSQVKQADKTLDVAEYNQLSKPSVDHPVQYYSSFKPGLYSDVINKYMVPGMRDRENNLVVMQ